MSPYGGTAFLHVAAAHETKIANHGSIGGWISNSEA